jgi:hypothetical protein
MARGSNSVTNRITNQPTHELPVRGDRRRYAIVVSALCFCSVCSLTEVVCSSGYRHFKFNSSVMNEMRNEVVLAKKKD